MPVTIFYHLTRPLVLAIYIALLAGCSSSMVELISDIKEVDANEIISSLYKSGIEGVKTKTKDGSAVMVDVEQLANAVALLKAQGLPSQQFATLGEVFKKEGMISTPLEEKARYIYALSQELESTLSQIDGVLIARVHLVLPDENQIGQESQKPSAAVFVKHLPDLDPDTINLKIKRIVSRAVPGLNEEDPDSVSVSFIISNVKSVEIKWVDLWGYRMTERSASRFKATAKKTTIIVSIVGGLIALILTIRHIRISRRKTRKAKAVATQKTSTQAA